jgi:hypothetical protein
MLCEEMIAVHSENHTKPTNTLCGQNAKLLIFNAGGTHSTGHSGRAVWGVGRGRLVAGIVGSNPAQGMDVCPRLSVLCCPV